MQCGSEQAVLRLPKAVWKWIEGDLSRVMSCLRRREMDLRQSRRAERWEGAVEREEVEVDGREARWRRGRRC